MDECGLSFRYMLISLSILSQDAFDWFFGLMLMGIVYESIYIYMKPYNSWFSQKKKKNSGFYSLCNPVIS